jgi:hypothetical protein
MGSWDIAKLFDKYFVEEYVNSVDVYFSAEPFQKINIVLSQLIGHRPKLCQLH